MKILGKRNAHFLLELLRGRENVWWCWQPSCHHEERERASREKQSGPQAPRPLFEALDLTRPAQVCPWSFSALSQLLSMLFSHQVTSEYLRPRGLQHSRFPCLSLSLGVCSDPCALSQRCYPATSSSVTPFSLCLQSSPAPGSFPTSLEPMLSTFCLSQRELGSQLLHLRWLWPCQSSVFSSGQWKQGIVEELQGLS